MRSPTPDQQQPGAEDDVDLATRPTEVVDVTVRPTVRLPRPRSVTEPPGGRAPLGVAAAAAAFVAAVTAYLPVVAAIWLASARPSGLTVAGIGHRAILCSVGAVSAESEPPHVAATASASARAIAPRRTRVAVPIFMLLRREI